MCMAAFLKQGHCDLFTVLCTLIVKDLGNGLGYTLMKEFPQNASLTNFLGPLPMLKFVD